MIADIDFRTLVGLAIVVLGLLSQLFGRKKTGGEVDSGTSTEPGNRPPGGGRPLPGPPIGPQTGHRLPSDWQREIEALLRGETPKPQSAPPPLPAAPPMMRPAPPPLSTAQPPIFEPEPAPLPVPRRLQVEATDDIESRPPPGEPLNTLAQSTAAHQRVAMLHAKVAEHMHRTDEQTEHPVAALPAARKEASPEVAALLASLRSPRSARKAILASIVLGPPGGLGEHL
jgi:hypothetical protein